MKRKKHKKKMIKGTIYEYDKDNEIYWPDEKKSDEGQYKLNM